MENPRSLETKAFAELAAFMYALNDVVLDGVYTDESRVCAVIADLASGGLRGKRVLDVGCGYGTTTLALARHAPRGIVAIDSSATMTDLFLAVLLSDMDLEAYVREKDASGVLGEFSARLLKHLNAMRVSFQRGLFCRNGGALTVAERSLLDPLPEDWRDAMDVVVANNAIHWPIRERRRVYEAEGIEPPTARARAMADTFGSLCAVLRPGGVAVMLEPKNFVCVDDDSDFDAELESTALHSHPVLLKSNALLDELLRERHGIEREAATPYRMFQTSELSQRLSESGLMLHHVGFFEGVYICDNLEAFFPGFPLHMVAVDLPFHKKLALMREVRSMLRQRLTTQDLELPVRVQSFVIVASKQ